MRPKIIRSPSGTIVILNKAVTQSHEDLIPSINAGQKVSTDKNFELSSAQAFFFAN